MILVILTLLLVALAAYLMRELLKLRGEPQIYAEVAQQLHQRAHELLVRKDQIESSPGAAGVADQNERWKNDLAQYMDDYEYEGRQRSRIHHGLKARQNHH